MICFIGISHTILYLSRKCSGRFVSCLTDPLFAIILFLICSFHRPSSNNSFIKYLLSITNSPASVRRLYKLLVNGSKHSLNPRICDVLAVGIGATNSELRRPWSQIDFFKAAQSYLLLGVTPHISNCKTPFDAGEPLNVEYGSFNFIAISLLFSNAA